MKLFCIQPGASTSTADVYTGLVGGLKELDNEILYYQLDTRIARAGSWLNWCWEQAKKKTPSTPEPNSADILFQACAESVVVAMWKRPDWVIVVSSMYYPKLFLKLLKRGGLKVALLLTESPYDDDDQYALAASVDMCWTNERTSVEKIRFANPHTFYLPHAYDPERHFPVNGAGPELSDIPAHDVVFIGTGFQERVDLLESMDWSGIDLGLYGVWDLIPEDSPLRKHVKAEEVTNTIAAALYRKAKIGLNLHRRSKGFGSFAPKISKAESLNPRAYELAACGCFYISDHRAEMDELFLGLVPTYTDAPELESQIRNWLEEDSLRKEIAERLPSCVEGHTWLARSRKMLSDLESVSPGLTRRKDIGKISR